MKVLVEGDVVDLGQLDEGTGVDWARVDKVCLFSFQKLKSELGLIY
jgi:hypothetical protein